MFFYLSIILYCLSGLIGFPGKDFSFSFIYQIEQKKDDSLVIKISHPNKKIHRCYSANNIQGLWGYRIVSELCAFKYSRFRGEFNKLGEQFTAGIEREQIDRSRLQKNFSDSLLGGRLKESTNPKIKSITLTELFRTSKEYKAYKDASMLRQLTVVTKVLDGANQKVRDLFIKEYLRFLFVKFGPMEMFNDPFVNKLIPIPEENRKNILIEYASVTPESRKFVLEMLAKSSASVLSVLNPDQTRMLERRLGLEKESFYKFLSYDSVSDFANDFENKQNYFFAGDSFTSKEYVGIEGLEKVKRKFKLDIDIRYHITEIDPRAKGRQRNVPGAMCLKVVNRASPVNSLSSSFASGSYVFLMDPKASEDQHRIVRDFVDKWALETKQTKTLKEEVQRNNQLLRDLESVLDKRFGLTMFRGHFKKSGPVAFFFFPGIDKQFGLTIRQLNMLKQKRVEVLKKIGIAKRYAIFNETKVLKKFVSDAKLKKLEQYLGMSLRSALDQRFDNLIQNHSVIFYRYESRSSDKVWKTVKKQFEPRVNLPRLLPKHFKL